jgi:hypothetical protein
MNIKADELATKGLNKKKIEPLLLPADRYQLFSNNMKVCSKYTKNLRENYHSRNMHQFLQEKYKWPDRVLNIIWWEAHGKALSSLSDGKVTIVLKFIHDHIACNYRESKFYTHRTPYCRACPSHIEDTDHIIKCKNDYICQQIRDKYFMKLIGKMTNMGTSDTTIRVITAKLRSWIYNITEPTIEEIVLKYPLFVLVFSRIRFKSTCNLELD